MRTKNLFIIVLFALFTSNIFANITLPKVISSNMVLQRNAKVPIWGKADAGEKIAVTFVGKTVSTIADANGKWRVVFNNLKLNAQPQNMTIEGNNKITLTNILVGDVWLCSGQSNMEYPLDYRLKRYAPPAKGENVALQELSKPKSDQIRYILAEKTKQTDDIQSIGWITSKNDTVLRSVSAVGYFFGKDLYENTNVPIGIISSSWGGTQIEEWTPAWAYEQSPFFKSQTTEKNFKIDGMTPGLKYASMIQPIVPFAVKGMIWYQGETNFMKEDQATYPEKMKLMLDTYRSLFKNPKMPFYYVQISPYFYTKRNDKKQHTPEGLAEFWEAQTNFQSRPHTGMVVTTDLVDDLSNIHPSYKWIVAQRLANWALAKDYKKKMNYASPSYKSMKVKDGKIILSFKNAAGGLISNDGKPLTWFTIAGADGNFVPAKAEIKDSKVIVWADEIKEPKMVRFAWNETAMPNLFSKEDLPVIPFRTGR